VLAGQIWWLFPCFEKLIAMTALLHIRRYRGFGGLTVMEFDTNRHDQKENDNEERASRLGIVPKCLIFPFKCPYVENAKGSLSDAEILTDKDINDIPIRQRESRLFQTWP
jgi:hypothetical protein